MKRINFVKSVILDLEINNVCYCTKCKKIYSVKIGKHCSLKNVICLKCDTKNSLLWFCWDYNDYAYQQENLDGTIV